jgi:hypothetical protein
MRFKAPVTEITRSLDKLVFVPDDFTSFTGTEASGHAR